MTQSALLLAAGKATRLGELRERYAKACVPIAGTTPLASLIEALIGAGVERFCINLHWQAEQVREVATAAVAGRAELLWLEEQTLLGTGGTLLAAQALLGELPSLVINAKQFSDMDWHRVLAAPPGTLVVHPASPIATFGGLRYRRAQPVLLGLCARTEQARESNLERVSVYTGIARPDPAWIPWLEQGPDEETVCLARHGFLPHAAAGHEVTVLEHDGWWLEISTPERVGEANRFVTQNSL